MTDLPNLFTTHLKIQGYKPVSIRSYRSDLNHFLGWLTLSVRGRNLSFSKDQFELIKYYFRESYVEAYKKYLIDNDLPSSTINRRLSTLRTLSDFCLKQGLISVDPTRVISNVTISPAKQDPALPDNIATQQNDILLDFKKALEKEGSTHNTIKNYLSDIREYVIYAKGQLNEKNMVKDFLQYLAVKGASKASLKRLESSLRKFYSWAVEEGYIRAKGGGRSLSNLFRSPHFTLRSSPFTLRASPFSLRSYRALPYFTYLNFLILIIFLAAIGFGLYRQFIVQAPQKLAFPNAPVTPKRFLSFQGLLTTSTETPITTATNVTFKLYDAAGTGTPPTGGNLLWNSGTCSIDPDASGIFDTILGSTCGTEIPSSVFTENNQVWMEITVISDTLSPRIQIATVAYALNAETLQGFPIASTTNADATATMGATARTIPAINPAGNLVLASASPTLWSTSGTFAIKGQALSIVSEANGNITLAPNGSGLLNLTLSANTGNVINATDANLGTSGGKEANTLIYGSVANNNTNVNLLKLASGSSPTPKFTVDYAGNASMAGALNVLSTINGLNISSGTISNAVWNGTAISTTYGGTGQNWSGVAQGSVPYFSGTGAMSTLAPTTAGYVLTTQGPSANPTWTAASGLGTNYWTLNQGALYPNYATADLFIGGTATSSANFAFINNLTGTPTASFSANLTLTGSVPVISTTNMRALTIGGITTGTIQMAAGSATPAFVLTTAGNVGIGTTNPGAKLDIWRAAYNSYAAAGTVTYGTILRNNQGLNDQGTGIGIQFQHDWENAGAQSKRRAGISSVSEASYSTSVGLALYTGDDGGSVNNYGERLRITGTGNVGIGTTAPAYKLDVNGQINSNTQLSFNDANGFIQIFRNVSPRMIFKDSSSYQRFVYDNYQGVFRIFSSPQDDGASGTERFRIDGSTGYVGIGTTNPAGALHIDKNTASNPALIVNQLGSGNLLEASGSGVRKFYVTNDGSLNSSGYATISGSLAVGYSSVLAGTGNAVFAGQVGIGTTSPGSALEIKTNSAGTASLQVSTQIYGAYLTTTAGSNTGDLFIQPVSGRSAFWDGTRNNYLQIYNGSALGVQIYASGTTFFNGGNVGIGTTAPSQKLDVSGNATISGTLALGPNTLAYAGTCDATAKGKQYFNGVTNIMYYCNGTSWITMGTSTSLTGSGTANYIPKWNTSSDLTNSILYDTGTNIGIGTTAPLAKLDISGDASMSGNLYMGNSLRPSNSPLSFDYKSGANTWATGMTLTNTGNVGIGTTNPTAPSGFAAPTLIVSGTGLTGIFANTTAGASGAVVGVTISGTRYANLSSTNTNTYVGSVANIPLGFITNNSELMRLSTSGGLSLGSGYLATDPGAGSMIVSGNVGIGTTGPGYKLDVGGVIRAQGADSGTGLFVNGTGGANRFALNTNSDGSWTMYDNGAGSYTAGITQKSGNVGIGTTGPNQKLEVAGGILGQSMVNTTGASSLLIGQSLVGDGTGSLKVGIYGVRPNSALDNAELAFYTINSSSFTEKMRIDKAGNVGIGTTGPDRPLVVSGASMGLYGSSPTFVWKNTASSDKRWDFGMAGNDLYMTETGVATRMVLQAGGNVGIGTTGPGAKLEVLGNIYSTDPTGGKNIIAISNNGTISNINATAWAGGSYTPITFTTSNSERVRIDTSGNVGIGITSPAYQLDVRGANGYVNALTGYCINGDCKTSWAAVAGGYWQKNNGVVSPAAIADDLTLGGISTASALTKFSGTNQGSSWLNFGGGTSDTFSASSSGSTKFLVNSSGNVGIGTTAPADKLDVSGGSIRLSSNNTYINMVRTDGTAVSAILARNDNQLGLRSLGGGIQFDSQAGAALVNITNAGNVGIGTTNPWSKFQVNQTGSGNLQDGLIVGDLYLNVTGSAGVSLGTDKTNNIAYLQQYKYGTGWGNLSLAPSGGNVGIGTTGPEAKLDVRGQGYFNVYSLNPANVLTTNATISDFGVLTYKNGAAAGGIGTDQQGTSYLANTNFGVALRTGGGYLYLNSTGNVGIGTTGPSTALEVVGTARAKIFADQETPQYFLDPGASGTSMAVFGNVGIGTTAPGMKLDVSGDIRTSGAIHVNTITSDAATPTYSALSLMGWAWPVGNKAFIFNTHNDAGNGFEKMVIMNGTTGSIYMQHNGGNVGIGTTAPTQKLTVNGVIYNSSDNMAFGGVSGIKRFQSGTNRDFAILNSGDAYGTLGLAGISVGSSYAAIASPTNGAIIEGNVGIGTTSPQQLLDVNGIIAAGNTTDGISLRLNGTVGEVLGINTSYSAYNPIEIRAQSTTQLYLNTTGNVGIGTTAPSNPLTVRSDTAPIMIGGAVGGSYNRNFGALSWDVVNSRDVVTLAGLTDAGIYAGGALRLLVRGDSGNVGIGTTAPGTKLEVSGNIRIPIGSVYDWYGGGAQWASISTSSDGHDVNINAAYDTVFNTSQATSNWIWKNSSATKMQLTAGGNLGIGVTAPTDKFIVNNGYNKLWVPTTQYGFYLGYLNTAVGNGALKYNSTTGEVTVDYSSLRFKKDVTDLNFDTSKIYDLRPVNFTWKSTNEKDFGFIAEEVYPIMPELVSLDQNNQPLSVKYERLGVLLLNEMKKQKLQIALLRSDLIGASEGLASVSGQLASLNTTTASLSANLSLNNTGDLSITLNPTTQKYEVKDSLGNLITGIIASAQATIGTIKAGLIQTHELIASNITVNNKILSPVVETSELRITDYELRITNKDGKVLTETQNNGQTTHFGDLLVQGNTTVSGTLTANSLQSTALSSRQLAVDGSATVSGTLYADKIVTKNGTFGDLLAKQVTTSTVSAQYITNNIQQTTNNIQQTTYNIVQSTPSANASTSASQLVSASVPQSASASATPVIDPFATPISSESAILLSQASSWVTSDPNANIKITSNVQILGRTSLADTSIAGQLMVDGSVVIDRLGISSLPTSTLYLQSSGWGPLDIMAGKVLVDLEGNIQTLGKIMAKEFAPLPNSDLTFNLERPLPATDTAHLYQPSSSFGKLLVKGLNNETVASIDAEGNGSFKKLTIAADFTATQSAVIAQINTNATSGIGLLPAGATEFTVYNPKITNNTLIYVTPEGSTQNKVLYVSAKQAENPQNSQKGFFKVAIDTPINTGIKFNWWLIN